MFLQRNEQQLKHKFGNSPTSRRRSTAMGNGLPSHPGDTQILGQTPPRGLTPRLWGRREGRNPNRAACSRHVSLSPAHLVTAPLVPETWILREPQGAAGPDPSQTPSCCGTYLPRAELGSTAGKHRDPDCRRRGARGGRASDWA